jgi:hypothetical protein
MPDEMNFPKYIFGLHEPGGERLMEEKGKKGWVLFTHGLGHDPNVQNGEDYRQWSDRGFGIIARLNHGYGPAGTLPLPQHYDAFAQRVRNFVADSQGGHIWIIGNEMNHGQERPEGQIITPDLYAACYKRCWQQIHNLPGHQNDQVVVGAVAPWNATTAYPSNKNGDWVQYFVDILQAIRNLGCPVDAISHHTYTHGHDPNLVFSEQKMTPPFQNYHYHFRCYRDFMNATPSEFRDLPVYITETDQDEPWENANRGWVQNAYKEINDWNSTSGNQQIRALILYRWPNIDKWRFENKGGVHEDFRAAMDHEYVWRAVKPTRQLNGYMIRDAFLDFFDQIGQEICGLPISKEIVEEGLKTQYVQSMQGQIQGLQKQIHTLKTTIPAQPKEQGEQIVEIVRPMWDNLVYELPRHPTKRYAMREMGRIKYLVINHSAVPATITAQKIAGFHVNNVKWPGIGYHFYLDGDGRILKTNDLTTVCYHVGKWDPVSVGICVGGNFTRDIPSPAQIKSTAQLVAWLLEERDLPIQAVKGKKEFIDTQSPGHQWLAGKKWKTLLLAEIKKAQVAQAKSHPPKPFYHYVLFWQFPDAWAEEDWYGAKEYIGRFRVTHGFSVDDAKTAKFVTLIGGTLGVDRKAERILLDAGCRVERISGKSPAETSKILTQMAHRGQRFLSFAG